jgi:ribosomal protein S18 acetylase RimI-like enzyme
MYVHPRYRGMGVGRGIVEKLLRAAQAMKGLLVVKLAVTSTNDSAIKLYQRLGFRRYATEPKALRVNGRFYDFENMMFEVMRRDQGDSPKESF